MKVPPAKERMIAPTKSGEFPSPIPIDNPVDWKVERRMTDNMMTFLDFVLDWESDTPYEMHATPWWIVIPMIRSTKTERF